MSAVDHIPPSSRSHRSGRSWGPAGFMAHHLGRYRARRAQRDYEASVVAVAHALRGEFREACIGLGLCQYVSVAAGLTVRAPRVGEVRGGPPLSFTVELLPGQEGSDFTKKENGTRLAHSLGGHGLRVEPVAGRWVRITVLDRDPLASVFGVPKVTVNSGSEPLILGRTEDGATLGHAIALPGHLGTQGGSGSGKSMLGYGICGQLAAAPDVIVCGSDITGLLLGRPWDGTVHRPHQTVGTGDIEAHAVGLERLVAEMDRRLEHIPPRQDRIVATAALPTMFVVLEEFPGLLRAAEAQPKPGKGQPTIAERIRAAVLRLLSEGRKAAFRVFMLAQRFEANSVAGGYARDQIELRISFRVPADSLAMLHGDDSRHLGAAHANAEPGVAYLSGLGRGCERIRVPYIGTYADYCDRIARYGRRAHGAAQGGAA